MSMDGLILQAVIAELSECMEGRIGKIHQPTDHDLIMQIRAGGRTKRLLISANPTYPRIHFTERKVENPMEAPMFCMLLRKHCENGVLVDIKQPGLERIVHLVIRHRNEMGDIALKQIIVELTGRHSNIILTDDRAGTVLDGIHHVTPAISRYRTILPGSPYVAPPIQDKQQPFETDAVSLAAWIKEAREAEGPDFTLKSFLVNRFQGISPLHAQELAFRMGENASSAIFVDTLDQIRRTPEPNIADMDGKSLFAIMNLTHLQGTKQTYPSVSEGLEAFYGNKAERDSVKQKTGDLLKRLNNEIDKNRRKMVKLRKEINQAEQAEQYRVKGELLTAYLHQVGKGDKQIVVPNYYEEDGAEVQITLDHQLTPAENAQRYFKKYNKSKKSAIHAKTQIEEATKETAYLESVVAQLENADAADVDEIRDELAEQGYVRRRKAPSKGRKKSDRPTLYKVISSEGIPIYVGKNNTQNDYLTNRFARPNDIWFHTKDIPGSHVVVRADSFGEATLEEAALLAAWFSKARESGSIPVDYTEIRHVRKPNGAKPGYVIYDHHRTLYVTPDEERIRQLEARRE